MQPSTSRLVDSRPAWLVSGIADIGLSRVLLVAALCLTALIYWPGLSGGFLFDDFPNLEQIGARGPIESLELLRAYLASGSAGPTGRPISLLSFLIDANDWPADPWPFKRTNLVIHLLAGLVLFATTRRLLEAMGRSQRDAAWIGLVSATLWLVNPFFVSTTLYAVQRMTQLAALFVLAGIWCYLHGRSLLRSKPWSGYLAISIGVPVFTLLAVLSKENGALLPLLVLIIHLLLKNEGATPAPSRLWSTIFLGVPSALVIGYLLMRIPGAERSFGSRDFTLYERLLSQPAILWDYLYHLAVPHIQTRGLFQDSRAAATGLLTPWTTLPALLGLLVVTAAAWAARTRWPLLSLAIFFLLGAHLVESTTIPLELYFEHRSYLPAAFLFLPVAAAAYDAASRSDRPITIVALVATLIAGYSLATWQRASLWGDPDQLMLVWAGTNPDSDRAQVSAAQSWLRLDRPDQALATIEAAAETMPDSVLVNVSNLAFRAELGLLTVQELRMAAQRIRSAPFDAQSLNGLEHIVKLLNARGPLLAHAEIVGDLLEDIAENSAGRVPIAHRKATYLRGLLLAGQGQPELAMPYLTHAFERYRSVDTGLRIVSDLAIMGHYVQALEMLTLTEVLLSQRGAQDEQFPEATYRSEISRLRDALLEDMKQRNAVTVLSGQREVR